MPKRARKKAAKKRTTKRPPAKPSEETIGQAVLLLISMRDREEVRAAFVPKLNPAAVDALIEEAERRIVLAAAVDRVEALGCAVERSDQLYEMAVATNDYTAANVIEKDRRKLLDLYPRLALKAADQASQAAAESDGELERVVGYLAPLNLAPEGTPAAELARLAVERLIG